MTFERIVDFYPAHDDFNERTREGSRSSMRIKFVLKGTLGATQFMIGTCWGPRQSDVSTRRLIAGGTFDPCRPNGWDVGYHSPHPQYDGQSEGECDLLPGGCCYYDGSGLRADDWIDDFITGGSDWVWRKLEEEYRELFCASGIEAPSGVETGNTGSTAGESPTAESGDAQPSSGDTSNE